MKSKKLQQKMHVLCFIVVVNLILMISHYTYEINKFYIIEENNSFRWQKFMNESEFEQLRQGMTYFDVVKIAKGRGEQLTEQSFVWQDEQSLKRSYIITFTDDLLVRKYIYIKHHPN